MGITIINHPHDHHFYRWYKPWKMGGSLLLYAHYIQPWLMVKPLSHFKFPKFCWVNPGKIFYRKGRILASLHGLLPQGEAALQHQNQQQQDHKIGIGTQFCSKTCAAVHGRSTDAIGDDDSWTSMNQLRHGIYISYRVWTPCRNMSMHSPSGWVQCR